MNNIFPIFKKDMISVSLVAISLLYSQTSNAQSVNLCLCDGATSPENVCSNEWCQNQGYNCAGQEMSVTDNSCPNWCSTYGSELGNQACICAWGNCAGDTAKSKNNNSQAKKQ
jgi:hypothetical protein